MNCNTTHYRANSSSVPGDPTAGQLIAALSISSPADRMKPTWGPLVKESAERIAHAIGHRKDLNRISAT